VHTSSISSSSRLRLGSTQQSVAASDNPLLAPNWKLKLGQLPLWDKIQPQHIQPAVDTLIEQETASLEFLEQDLLAGSSQLSFDRVFKPLTQIQLRTDFVSGQFSHLSVSCLLSRVAQICQQLPVGHLS
jgi:Zn-dependent oligopeptidase